MKEPRVTSIDFALLRDAVAHALEATGPDRRARLVALPKTDLHAHSLLSPRLEDYDAIAPAPIERPAPRFQVFSDFEGYIRRVLLPAMGQDPERLVSLIRRALVRMIEEGVRYTEISVDLLIPRFLDESVSRFAARLEAVRHELADRIEICFEGGVNRGVGVDTLEAALGEFLATGCLGSLDLYGDETLAGPRTFIGLYDRARDSGLKLKAHTGEFCGPDQIRETLESLRVTALQHGVRAAEDPRLMDELVERGTTLNLCPTSNVKLGVVPDMTNHPLPRLLRHGVRVTVNTDDYTVFGADVCDEIEVLATAMGLTADEIARVLVHGLDEAPASVRSLDGPARP